MPESSSRSALPIITGTSAMNTEEYRALMRHQAGAVTVIASGPAGGRAGLTATAVASLSDRPPTLLACINQTAGAHDAIVRASAFSVNLLAADQQSVAECFAGKGGRKGEDRFADFSWVTLATGSPILVGALASLDCRVVEQQTFSTHSIFIAHVLDGQFRNEAEPLLYFRGDYWNFGRGQ